MLEIEDRCEIIVASLLGIDSPKKRRSFVKKKPSDIPNATRLDDWGGTKRGWVVTHPALKYLWNTMASELLGDVELGGFGRSHGVRRARTGHRTVRTGHTGRTLERPGVFNDHTPV